MSKHTPEPWFTAIITDREDEIMIQAQGGHVIADIRNDDVEYIANANLIAAAPELLRLLKEVCLCDREHTDLLYEDTAFRKEIESAIAKAEGREQ